MKQFLMKMGIFLLAVVGTGAVAGTIIHGLANAQRIAQEQRLETPEKTRLRQFMRREEVLTARQKSELAEAKAAADLPTECPIWATIVPDERIIEDLDADIVFDVTMQLPEIPQRETFLKLEFVYDYEVGPGRSTVLEMKCTDFSTGEEFVGTLELTTTSAIKIGPALLLKRPDVMAKDGYRLDDNYISVCLTTSFEDQPRKLSSFDDYKTAWMGEDYVLVRVNHLIYPRDVETPQIQGWCPVCEHDRQHCDCGYFERLENPEPDTDESILGTEADPYASEHWNPEVDGVDAEDTNNNDDT